MPAIVIEEITDPNDNAQARVRRERFDRNAAWLQDHAQEIYMHHRGKCVCAAGQQIFVADSPEEAMALAQAAHPDDDGSFVQYIPRERFARIYANRW